MAARRSGMVRSRGTLPRARRRPLAPNVLLFWFPKPPRLRYVSATAAPVSRPFSSGGSTSSTERPPLLGGATAPPLFGGVPPSATRVPPWLPVGWVTGGGGVWGAAEATGLGASDATGPG